MSGEHTLTPWEYVASTEHHGPYVTASYGGDICDCYCMSNPSALSVRNGGNSYPIHHQGEQADANAQFIVRAVNSHAALVEALKAARHFIEESHTMQKAHLRLGRSMTLPIIDDALKAAGADQ